MSYQVARSVCGKFVVIASAEEEDRKGGVYYDRREAEAKARALNDPPGLDTKSLGFFDEDEALS